MPYGGNPTVKNFKTDMLSLSFYMSHSFHEVVSKQADELIQNMRGAVPRRTGTLAASLRKRDFSTVTAGPFGQVYDRVTFLVVGGGPMTTKRTGTGHVYDYAVATEFGTYKEKAEPFFYPAARLYVQAGQTWDDYRETVDDAIAENEELRRVHASNYYSPNFSSSHDARGHAIDLGRFKQIR